MTSRGCRGSWLDLPRWKRSGAIRLAGRAAVTVLLLSACSVRNGGGASAALQSVYTDLSGGSCTREADKSDPNETPLLVCPGVGGYSIIVRRVDAGRQSIDIIDPARRPLPLNYQEFVTRNMSNLAGKAEWRVAAKDGKQVPVALIVRVQAREDADNPENVTHTYIAVAKILSNHACVTDRIVEGTRPEDDVRRVADSAQERPCAPPQPKMTADGVVIR